MQLGVASGYAAERGSASAKKVEITVSTVIWREAWAGRRALVERQAVLTVGLWCLRGCFGGVLLQPVRQEHDDDGDPDAGEREQDPASLASKVGRVGHVHRDQEPSGQRLPCTRRS